MCIEIRRPGIDLDQLRPMRLGKMGQAGCGVDERRCADADQQVAILCGCLSLMESTFGK
jgi:hypothetical protein